MLILVKWSNLTSLFFQLGGWIWWNKWFKPNVGKFKPNVGSHVPVLWSIWEMNTNNKQDHSRTFTAILNASLVTSWHPDIPKVCLQSIGPGRSSKAAGAGKSFFFPARQQDGRENEQIFKNGYILDAFGDEEFIWIMFFGHIDLEYLFFDRSFDRMIEFEHVSNKSRPTKRKHQLTFGWLSWYKL